MENFSSEDFIKKAICDFIDEYKTFEQKDGTLKKLISEIIKFPDFYSNFNVFISEYISGCENIDNSLWEQFKS